MPDAPLQRLRGPGGLVLLVRQLPPRSWYRVEGIEAQRLTRDELFDQFNRRTLNFSEAIPFALVGGTFTGNALDHWCRRGKSTAWLAARAVWE